MNGMSTQNSFLIAKAENALVIPMRALGRRLPEKDKEGVQAYQVQVLSGENPLTREIGVGLVTRSLAEVKPVWPKVKLFLSKVGHRIIPRVHPVRQANRA